MPTCPNCGEIVMEGDPYCPHCGAHFKWNFIDEDDDYSSSPYDFPAGKPAYDAQTEYEKSEHFLDFGEVSKTYVDADEETLDYIVLMTSAIPSRQRQLKAVIRQYQKAPDFRGFYIKKDCEFEVYYFYFIQQNEYVKTTHEMIYHYDPEYYCPYNAFEDVYCEHNHDGLVKNPRFRKMIESTGLEFEGCGGGYEVDCESVEDVKLTDEISIRVYFNVNDKIRQYKLDLDNMQLSSDYNEY